MRLGMTRLFCGSLFLISLVVLGGCSETRIPEEAFPDQVGSRWVYSAYDSLRDQRDTVTTEIIDRRQVSFGNRSHLASVWLSMTNSNKLKWNYVTTDDDTVSIWAGTQTYAWYLEFRFIFPLRVGQTWSGSNCWPIRVIDEHTVLLPDGQESVAFLVGGSGFCVDSDVVDQREFVPGLGMISMRWFEYDYRRYPDEPFHNRNETWTLMSADLVKESPYRPSRLFP